MHNYPFDPFDLHFFYCYKFVGHNYKYGVGQRLNKYENISPTYLVYIILFSKYSLAIYYKFIYFG